MMRALQTTRRFLATLRTTRHPAFLAAAAVVGLGLMFGAPLIAQDHGPSTPAAATQESHAADPHASDAHGATTAAADPGAAGHGADDAHAAEGHGDDAHGEEKAGGGGVKHFPSLVVIIASVIDGHELHAGPDGLKHAKHPAARFLILFEDVIYSAVLILLLSLFFMRASRSLTTGVPGKLQNLAEFLVEGLDNFIRGVIGPEGRRFVPFLGTLGLYIYTMNIFGLVPLMKSPTSVLNTTAAMAICVFAYVQFTGFRMGGLGYVRHLAGDPRDAVGWAMVPLMLPLHLIGEVAKPLSLSLRLFGNVMGEELLLAVFAGLGVVLLAATHLPLGVPLHLPFLLLGLLFTLIQAVVFTLLSTIYISLVLPHHDHGEHGHEASH